METAKKVQGFSHEKYYNLDHQKHATNVWSSLLRPCTYILVGILVGFLAAQKPTYSPQFKWVKFPTLLQSSQPTQLYDASQIEKFVHLRQRIDEEFNEKLNDLDAPTDDYDPFRLSLELLDRIDQEFDSFLQGLMASNANEDLRTAPWRELPTFDVEDTKSDVKINCKLAGANPEDVRVDLKGQQLLVSVNSKHSDETSEGESHFARIFIVPEGVTAKDIAANIEGDEMHIVVTKPKFNQPEPEPIVIQTADP